MKKITPEELHQHCLSGSWRALEQRANSIVSLAEEFAKHDMCPTLGGGPRGHDERRFAERVLRVHVGFVRNQYGYCL